MSVLFNPEPKYSLCDLSIVPAIVSNIESRKECSATYSDDMLPIFTAPMDSVANEKNYQIFLDNNINPIIHRNVSLNERIRLTKERGLWCAYRLSEFETIFCDEDSEIYDNAEIYYNENGDTTEIYALIDVANGHMSKIFELAKKAKTVAESRHVYLCLMAGNIANPQTYKVYCDAGIDYVRCSIGTGSMCLTTANTAVSYSNASLLMEIAKVRDEYKDAMKVLNNENYTLTKVIADGGIRNFSDAVVALACGADYVMIGGLFASFIDSCARLDISSGVDLKDIINYGYCSNYDEEHDVYTFILPRSIENANSIEDTKEEYDLIYYRNGLNYAASTEDVSDRVWRFYIVKIMLTSDEIYRYDDVKKFLLKYTKLSKSSHGMSSKEAQIGGMVSLGETVDKSKLKTSEGKTIQNNVRYSCQQWTDNFVSYLKSAMSYTNHKYLEDFIGNVQLVVRSYGTSLSINK